jgi:hypothetical protein
MQWRLLPTAVVGLALCEAAAGQDIIDIVSYFQKAYDAGRTGLARKTKTVDARPAKQDEVIVTIIAGEGKETQSPPAKPGDMVVRNRCPETGNEQFLVAAATFADRYEGPAAATFADRYEGPIEGVDTDGWSPYRPRGAQVRYMVVPQADGQLTFIAPWGEEMIARPGDSIVQDVLNPKDTYRVARAAFACTYHIIRRSQE